MEIICLDDNDNTRTKHIINPTWISSSRLKEFLLFGFCIVNVLYVQGLVDPDTRSDIGMFTCKV